ncbi:hypothetical protein B0H17DRAFT_97883 [Mycena rosella]|uniref:Uncharacterized protein n=1 Tax=Mycena rosella TaxID=1033263 RepID=A0AAD7E2B0_MYCRO|nr:hypothetical protein B0H17DRAFT_97883 [Mycena rosella]
MSGGSISLAGIMPTLSVNAAPKCEVRATLGKSWDCAVAETLGKDFASYDVRWLPTSDRDNIPHEMQVEFGLGMNLYPNKEEKECISSVLRHQITVWVLDPGPTKCRGILLLTSTYIPDALTETRLTMHESITVNLNEQWSKAPPTTYLEEGTQNSDAAMSVSLAAFDKSKKKKNAPQRAKMSHTRCPCTNPFHEDGTRQICAGGIWSGRLSTKSSTG